VTDHVVRTDDPWPSQHERSCVDGESFAAYREEIGREQVRALSMYGPLLVPGLELTYNDATTPLHLSSTAYFVSDRALV
jgi:hypothetical protein